MPSMPMFELGDLPPGWVAVHNDVPRTQMIGRPGSHRWTEPEGELPRLRCYCDEISGTHYRTCRFEVSP